MHMLTMLIGLIDHQAHAFLNAYANSLADIVTDQASRLGVQGSTSARKAINVFGAIGEQTESMALQAADLAPADLKGSKRMRYRSLPRLMLYATRRMAIATFFVILGWIVEFCKWGHKTVNANKIIILLLLGSAVMNAIYTGNWSWEWWQERNAAGYMAKLGVKPNLVMAKSIWIKDMDDIIATSSVARNWTHSEGGAW